MLRTAVARSNACLEQGARAGLRRQWQPQRLQQPFSIQRGLADFKPVVLPGSQSETVAGVPQPPIIASPTGNLTSAAKGDAIPPTEMPRTPPTPAEVKAIPPASPAGNLPPTGTGTARTSSPPPPPPPKQRRRFRSFLLSLILLSTFGYAGSVYYALNNDNFHDFFTEYVPFGEDAVAYFEEREFRKRFPTKEFADRNWPQTRGENKITIGRQSGVNPRVAKSENDNQGSDLGHKGRHTSALDDNKAKKEDPKKEETRDQKPAQPAKAEEKPAPKKEQKPATPDAKTAAVAAPLVDHLDVTEANERAVQELVKLVNNVITAVNASPEAPKFASTLAQTKQDINNVIAEIRTLKDSTAHDAETKIKSAHAEFDNAAKELVRRLESEMREQETRWREEYEQEREKLSTSYQQKLSAELDAAKKVSEEKNKKALLEQEINLQKKFMDDVKSKIEEERNGRLSKLDELSSSVQELEKLTGQWNEIVDATLQTQHLQVALEAVRAKLQEQDTPTPFINELVALKEVSKNNDVVNAAIATINPAAYQRGIPSVAALIDRFRRVATEVRKASLLPEDAGVASHAASAVLSRFMFQKKSDRGLPEGDDVEATLARTEVLLEEGDLDAAAREMNSLKGWAGVLSRDWVGECRRILEVRQAVDVISTEARLQSLLVD